MVIVSRLPLQRRIHFFSFINIAISAFDGISQRFILASKFFNKKATYAILIDLFSSVNVHHRLTFLHTSLYFVQILENTVLDQCPESSTS
jgi:hypothetical protein